MISNIELISIQTVWKISYLRDHRITLFYEIQSSSLKYVELKYPYNYYYIFL